MGQYTSYYLYQKFEKRGTQDWIPVYPNVYSINGDGTQPTVIKKQNDDECGYTPIHDYSKQYLTLIPTESTTTFEFYSISGDSISYSLDSGSTWNTLASGVSTPSVAVGQKIMWKASGLPVSPLLGGSVRFISNKLYDVEGNIMSMVSGDSFVTATTIPNEYQFQAMFAGSNVRNAQNLVLPATTLARYCYSGMFAGCASLITAPALPATTLVEQCYREMFEHCTSLTTAPTLPATTLATQCYRQMFDGCTSLTTAPQLPATTLEPFCYYLMFLNCTSLTTAPALSASTLARYCYQEMFAYCRSLATAPELPATTLAEGCYSGMFLGCTSLTNAPELPATTLVEQCYRGMFEHCTSIVYSPMLKAETLAEGCYRSMFVGCSSLNDVYCLATDISATNCTKYWLDGVASSGTFFKKSSMSSWTTGESGIPQYWTVVNV